ncbi:hypothetical protein D3C83_82830 [compost metagenome]
MSARMKAAAPITGGASWPPVEAVASMALANAALNPVRFISGMVMMPSTSTLATALPETVPKSPDETIDALAAPPQARPVTQ